MKRMHQIPIAASVNKTLQDLARQMGGGQVKVGFMEGATYPDGGPPVAAVAFWNEFGTSTAPARPFFRPMVAAKSPEWGKQMAALSRLYKFDGQKVLAEMGQIIEGELQDSISDVTGPPLSPVTLLLRERFWTNPQEITGGDVAQAFKDIAAGVQPSVTGTQAHPLLWTQHMIQSVSSEMVKK